MVDRCTMCTDLANEFADIACGDAWSPVYEERGKGWSLVMGRTERGAGLLEEMAEGGYLSLQGLEEQAAIGMHSHMLDFKNVALSYAWNDEKSEGLQCLITVSRR